MPPRAVRHRPPNILYGVEDRPPLAVNVLTGLQHVGLMSVFLMYPALLAQAAGPLNWFGTGGAAQPRWPMTDDGVRSLSDDRFVNGCFPGKPDVRATVWNWPDSAS